MKSVGIEGIELKRHLAISITNVANKSQMILFIERKVCSGIQSLLLGFKSVLAHEMVVVGQRQKAKE